MAERKDGFIKRTIKEAVEKSASFFKKIDFFLIGSGVVIMAFAPAFGAVMIIGSSITIIPAEMAQRWAKKK